ncbi:MAG TPA: DUF4198 domain-containing protein [Methanotrichaceae archaeon]|nr:MAG: Nickel uptake substrate-specific transmembrane region [Methanosaeta sp. PtaU1.Bin028]HOT06896.1 DUF4198 domain-containing protein [Methanotrichaceae archaeon]
MKPFILALLLFGAMAVPACAHSLWVESNDVAEAGDLQRVYSLYGHAGSSSSMNVPLMDATYLLTPEGQRLDLKMEKGNWLAGFGWMEYLFKDVVLHWPGDYMFVAARSPSVYDPAWGGSSPSNPRLGYSFAQMVIHAGNQSGESWDAGLPLKLQPGQAPYQVKIGDNVTFQVEYDGKPVNASYSASYWTWDAHDGDEVQTGFAGDQGSFQVNFSQAGPWQVGVSTDIPGQGNWTATYDHSAGRFKSGDQVPYNTTRYSTVMSIWVKK